VKAGEKQTSKKMKVYRGEGNNFKGESNQGFHWVATDKGTASNYAGANEKGKLNIKETFIDIPKNPFSFPYKGGNTSVRGKDIAGLFREVLIPKIKSKEMPEKQWREVQKLISDFEVATGNELKPFHTQINDKVGSKLASKILSKLGYDSVVIKEDGIHNTYGIIKK